MSIKNIVIFSVTGMLCMYIYALSIDFNGCGKGIECYSRLVGSTKISPLFNTFLALLLSVMPFVFVSKSFFNTWRKIMIPVFILLFIVLVFTNNRPESGLGYSMDVSKKNLVYFLAPLIIVLSWLIVLWGFLKKGK